MVRMGEDRVKIDRGILTQFESDNCLIYLCLFLMGEDGEDKVYNKDNTLGIDIERDSRRARRSCLAILTQPKSRKSAVPDYVLLGEDDFAGILTHAPGVAAPTFPTL